MGGLVWFAIAVACVLTGALTWLLYPLAAQRGWFVPPQKKRDIHKKPTPRIGGMVMVLVFTLIVLGVNYLEPELFATLNFPFSFWGISIDKRLLGVLAGGLALAVVMAFDDWHGVKAGWKLYWQIIIWAIVVASGIGIASINNPFGGQFNLDSRQTAITIGQTVYHFVWLADMLLLIWMLGMMNVVNFIDGADGLATGLGVIGFIVIGLLSLSSAVNQPAVATLSFLAAAVSLGFLIFNFYPAKAFLGDTGAMWIGFMLAVLSVISGGKVITVFAVLAVVIIDGAIVVFDRIRRGQNPMTTSDQSHVHHRFLRAGLTVPQAVLAIYLMSAIFGLTALLTTGLVKFIIIGSLSIITLIFLLWLRTNHHPLKGKYE